MLGGTAIEVVVDDELLVLEVVITELVVVATDELVLEVEAIELVDEVEGIELVVVVVN